VSQVIVDGLSMYYEWHGGVDAEPLVLICGLGLDVSEVPPALLAGLARRYRVLAFDNRGAGRTDMPAPPYTVEQMAADTAGLMRAVGLARATVLGISLGGRIALALAVAEPDLVGALVLASTGARVRRTWRRTIKMAWHARRSARQGTHPQAPHAFRAQVAASAAADLRSRLGEVRAPALILHGVDDRSMPLPLAHELCAGLRRAQLRTFPGGHHFLLTGAGRQAFLDAVTGWRPGG
jgi:pimeloyl-ACP methyl ester carboxylesterase